MAALANVIQKNKKRAPNRSKTRKNYLCYFVLSALICNFARLLYV